MGGLQPLPADNAAADLPAPDKIVNYVVSAVAVRAGAIDITFGNRANGALKGKILTLRPAVVDDAPVVPVTWVCGYAAAPDKMTVKGTNNTSVPARYLPLKCRGRPRSSSMRTIEAGALTLVPQTREHAEEMFAVLGDPAIYTYENAPPPSVEWLRARFEKLESRQSADGAEQWLNWVIRLAGNGLIGYVQATVRRDGSAAIAYEIGKRALGPRARPPRDRSDARRTDRPVPGDDVLRGGEGAQFPVAAAARAARLRRRRPRPSRAARRRIRRGDDGAQPAERAQGTGVPPELGAPDCKRERSPSGGPCNVP